MKIIKQGSQYLIKEKGTNGHTLEITAYVSIEGITLYNKTSQLDFNFIDSQPEVVAKIGAMIRKAGLKSMKGKI